MYSGFSDSPERTNASWWDNDKINLREWWDDTPNFPFKRGVSFQHKRRIGQNFDLVIGARYNKENNYIKFVDKDRMGFNLKFRYIHPKIAGLTFGINTNLMHEVNDRFIFFCNYIFI